MSARDPKTNRRPLNRAIEQPRLEALAHAGLSTRQAAQRLGITKNAVIGRARDWGVKFDSVPPRTGGCNSDQARRGWATRRSRRDHSNLST